MVNLAEISPVGPCVCVGAARGSTALARLTRVEYYRDRPSPDREASRLARICPDANRGSVLFDCIKSGPCSWSTLGCLGMPSRASTLRESSTPRTLGKKKAQVRPRREPRPPQGCAYGRSIRGKGGGRSSAGGGGKRRGQQAGSERVREAGDHRERSRSVRGVRGRAIQRPRLGGER